MLLDNIRHLRSEVEKTNREINRSRQKRLYADLLKDDVYQERELPYGSRFYKPKLQLAQKTTVKTEITDTQ